MQMPNQDFWICLILCFLHFFPTDKFRDEGSRFDLTDLFLSQRTSLSTHFCFFELSWNTESFCRHILY